MGKNIVDEMFKLGNDTHERFSGPGAREEHLSKETHEQWEEKKGGGGEPSLPVCCS